MIYYTTVTSKGQVTLPAYIREKLHILPGKKVGFSLDHNDHIVINVPPDLDELRARTKAHMKRLNIQPVTDEQIDEIMAQAAVERYKRSLQ